MSNPQQYGPYNQPPAPPKKKRTGLKITGGILGGLLLIGIGMNMSSSDVEEPTTASPVTPTATASAVESSEAPQEAEKKPKKAESTKKAEPKPEKTEPKVTKTQEQALRAAEEYLAVMAFSKKGLQDQLVYDKHSTADAKWAVNHVDADWMKQAVLAAQSYLAAMSFSKQGLIDQLVYDGFTKEQAKHGANEALKD